MNKLNQLGMSAIEFRREFLNTSYPELVHNSIGYAIDKNFEACPTVMAKIKDANCSLEQFKEFLLTQEECRKSYEELLLEFDEIRKSLRLDDIDVETVSEVQSDYISVKKEFLLNESFLKNYFYIESDNEFDKLMSRKGFVEKFAILRLKKIASDFLLTLDDDLVDDFSISNTPVFFNSDKNVYGIYLEMKLDVNTLDNDEDIEYVRDRINTVLEASRVMFEEKMKA